MKRAGILTFTYGDNYGQRLQNLALQEQLKKYVDEVCTIRQLQPKSSSRKISSDIKRLVFFGPISSIRRHNAFVNFDTHFISYYETPISEVTSKSFPQEQFDFFVAGSDQIWSPYSPDVNSTMFLTFTEKPKRIALSPSIAAEEIPEQKKEEYRDYFLGFNYLSVREDRGAGIIKELTGQDVDVLIDPTLMHDATFWSKYVKRPRRMPNQKYACCYFLGKPQSSYTIDDICNINRLYKVDILNDKVFKSLGPQEFLYLIKNAEVVFTDSYHGTIFSCIFHTPFIVCEREGSKLNMNSRFTTLFRKLNIKNRKLKEVHNEDALKLDFEEIDKCVKKERDITNRYLEEAIGSVKQVK